MRKIFSKFLIAGILVWLPVLGTYYVLSFIVRLMDKSLALLPQQYQPHHFIGFDIPGIGLLFTLIIIIVTGMIVTNILGKRLFHLWERFLARIPLVRTLHGAFKQITHAVVTPNTKSFNKVYLLEYPRRGIWSMGFQTSRGFSGVPIPDEVCSVFVPTTPNPTSGFLTFIPRKELIEVDIPVEQALKMIISLGVIIPEQLLTPGQKSSNAESATAPNKAQE